LQKEERERRQRRTATDEQSKERGNSKATAPTAIQRPHAAGIQRPKKPHCLQFKAKASNCHLSCKGRGLAGSTSQCLNGLSQAPSPPSIYYMHHRGNTSCKIPYTRASPSDPAQLLTCPRRAAHKSSVLGQIKPCCRCTKKKPAAAQPRNSPQELQFTTAALEVGYASSTIPYPCWCGQRPVHRPGTGSLHPHRPPRAARKGKETKLRPNKTRPPQRPGRVPPAYCSLGQQTSLYTAQL
jgi:hypothetical protein